LKKLPVNPNKQPKRKVDKPTRDQITADFRSVYELVKEKPQRRDNPLFPTGGERKRDFSLTSDEVVMVIDNFLDQYYNVPGNPPVQALYFVEYFNKFSTVDPYVCQAQIMSELYRILFNQRFRKEDYQMNPKAIENQIREKAATLNPGSKTAKRYGRTKAKLICYLDLITSFKETYKDYEISNVFNWKFIPKSLFFRALLKEHLKEVENPMTKLVDVIKFEGIYAFMDFRNAIRAQNSRFLCMHRIFSMVSEKVEIGNGGQLIGDIKAVKSMFEDTVTKLNSFSNFNTDNLNGATMLAMAVIANPLTLRYCSDFEEKSEYAYMAATLVSNLLESCDVMKSSAVAKKEARRRFYEDYNSAYPSSSVMALDTEDAISDYIYRLSVNIMMTEETWKRSSFSYQYSLLDKN